MKFAEELSTDLFWCSPNAKANQHEVKGELHRVIHPLR